MKIIPYIFTALFSCLISFSITHDMVHKEIMERLKSETDLMRVVNSGFENVNSNQIMTLDVLNATIKNQTETFKAMKGIYERN